MLSKHWTRPFAESVPQDAKCTSWQKCASCVPCRCGAPESSTNAFLFWLPGTSCAWFSLASELSNQNNKGKVRAVKQPALWALHPPLPTFLPSGLHTRLQLYSWPAVYELMSAISLSLTLSVTQIKSPLPVKCPIARPAVDVLVSPTLIVPKLGNMWGGRCWRWDDVACTFVTHDIENKLYSKALWIQLIQNKFTLLKIYSICYDIE